MSLPRDLIKKICAIVRKEFEPLMKILGIKDVYVAENWNDAKGILDKLLVQNDVAIILIQKSLVPDGKSFIDLNLYRLYPIVVIIPDDKISLSASLQTFYGELIRKYIGYEIHLG
ncbi:MAG: V-type ATP synthase subunit F [Ignisphaera sp.]